jgi:hypothetical protein
MGIVWPFALCTGDVPKRSIQSLASNMLRSERRGRFPGFLRRVGKVAGLLGIQPQLSGHLDVGMGKMVALPHFDPSLVFFRYLILLFQRTIPYRAAAW